MNKLTRFAAAVLMSGAASVALFNAPASANALHGFCWGSTPSCLDNSTNTPTGDTTPSFGFTASSGPVWGDYRVDILVPNTISSPGSLSFGITGTQGGLFNTSSISTTASLFSATAWTSGNLGGYLGIFSPSPNNPIGAFLPSTQAVVGGASGFFVYQADLGLTTLKGASDQSSGPLLDLNSLLPLGSYIVSFLSDGFDRDWIATANSGAILETGSGGSSHSIPEPGTLLTFGIGLLALAFMARRKTPRKF